jgi:hypothetical protein
VEGLQQRNLGAAFVGRRKLGPQAQRLACGAHIAVFERDASGKAVRLG